VRTIGLLTYGVAVLKALRIPAVVLASAGAALVIANIGAFAYATGSIGYDIGYLQCGTPYPNASRLATRPVAARQWASPASQRVAVRTPAALPRASTAGDAWWSVPQQNAPASAASGLRTWFRPTYNFGIVGVDSGYPFMTTAHPGNPCLAAEYNHAPQAALYVNTGYDPSYVMKYTTANCSTQSAGISGSADQKAAWAVGCSEAQGDNGYTMAQGITSPVGWWLDVETTNSWCGQPGTACTDLTLNQYTLQGIIDTFTHIGAVPIGIYSNQAQWSAITGGLPVTGATSEWVATGATTAQQAAAYCGSNSSFSGQPVSLVQFLGSIDRDYAC
jgi:hypothetical protein